MAFYTPLTPSHIHFRWHLCCSLMVQWRLQCRGPPSQTRWSHSGYDRLENELRVNSLERQSHSRRYTWNHEILVGESCAPFNISICGDGFERRTIKRDRLRIFQARLVSESVKDLPSKIKSVPELGADFPSSAVKTSVLAALLQLVVSWLYCCEVSSADCGNLLQI